MKTKTKNCSTANGILSLILSILCLIWPSLGWARDESGGGGGGSSSLVPPNPSAPTPIVPTSAYPYPVRLPIGSAAELWFESFRFGAVLQFETHSPSIVGESKLVYRFQPGTLTASRVAALMKLVVTDFKFSDPNSPVTKLVSMQDTNGVWLLWGASHGVLIPSEVGPGYRFNGPNIGLNLSPMARIYIPGVKSVEYIPGADSPKEETRLNLHVREGGEVDYPTSLLKRTGTILVTMKDGRRVTYAANGDLKRVSILTATYEGHFGVKMMPFVDVCDLDVHINAISRIGDVWQAQMPAIEMSFNRRQELRLQSRVNMPMEGGGTQYIPTIGYAVRRKGDFGWRYFLADQNGRFIPVEVGRRGEQVPVPFGTPDFVSVDAGVYEIIPIADPRWVTEPIAPWIDYSAKGSAP